MNWQDKFKVNLLEVLYRKDQCRAPAGTPEGGQFASCGPDGGGGDGSALARMREVESEIVGNSYETAVVLDKDGNELFRVTGDHKSVTFGRGERARMKGEVLTHNHPDTETGFSYPDIKFLVENDLAEIRAVTDSYEYSMKPPSRTLMSHELSQNYKAVATKHHASLRKEAATQWLVDGWGETGFDADAWDVRLLHDTWTEVAERLGMEYSRLPRGG